MHGKWRYRKVEERPNPLCPLKLTLVGLCLGAYSFADRILQANADTDKNTAFAGGGETAGS